MVERFAVVLVELDPTRGSELQKTRPCVIVSPSEINTRLKTVALLNFFTINLLSFGIVD